MRKPGELSTGPSHVCVLSSGVENVVTLSHRASSCTQISQDARRFRCDLCARPLANFEVLMMRRAERELWRVVCRRCALDVGRQTGEKDAAA